MLGWNKVRKTINSERDNAELSTEINQREREESVPVTLVADIGSISVSTAAGRSPLLSRHD